VKLKIEYDLSYNPIQEYWDWIEENRTNGKWVVSQKVYKVYRHITKFLNDTDSEWEYDSLKANHAIEFVENYCKHSKGKLGGKPFIMELWQKALVAATFGIVHKIDRTRKYREVLLVVARKNGKSTLASAIGLYMQVADGEPGAEVYACATKKDQAKIIWLEAKRMVKKSSVLLKRIKPLVAELIADFNDSFFRPLGRDSDSLDGLNVHCALLDEIHAWTDDNLYDVIVDGTTARDEPLIFITTTAGTVREHTYDIKYDESERVINGFDDENGYHDEHFLPIIYELDNRKEWTDETCWIKANPGLGTIKKLDQLVNKVKKAIANSRLVKNLLCKDFNMPETTSEAWLTFEQANNTETFDLKVLKPRYGIGGTDLSSTTDLTAAKVIFKVPNDEHIYVLQMYWIPEDLVEKRVREDKIPYDIWIDQGLIRTCPGNKIHPKYVTEWFLEIQNEHDIYLPWFGYDGWSAEYWVEEMKGYFGKESMIPVIQGKKTLSSPMKTLGADLEKNIVVYNNNPIDKWCLCNTSVDIDKNDNIQPIKTSNPRRRIDGTAALLDAYAVLEEKLIEYENMI
jgi:phage terminase large subunit-like protein